MTPVSKIQIQIHYTPGDMISPSQASSLFQKSSINRTPGEICNILGYRGPNGIPEDFTERERTLISLVDVSDPEDETMKRGSPYNFIMLNSPKTGHLGKTINSDETNSDETCCVGSGTCEVTSVRNFRHRGVLISEISQKE